MATRGTCPSVTSSTEDRRSRGAAIVLAIALAFVAAYALALHGENTHLREQLLAATTGGAPLAAPAPQVGSPSVASPTPAAPSPVGPGRELTASQRAAFVERLRTGESGHVWIATTPADPEAAAYRASLVQAIKEAGWQVLSDDTLGFRVKPGCLIFLAGDSSPPVSLDLERRLERARREGHARARLP